MCTHPHQTYRNAADLQAWVRFWALTAKLCDEEDLPRSYTSEEVKAEEEATRHSAGMLEQAKREPLKAIEPVKALEPVKVIKAARDLPDSGATASSLIVAGSASASSVANKKPRSCVHQPMFDLVNLESVLAADKTFFVHLARDLGEGSGLLQSGFMASRYGQRLIHVIIREDMNEPFVGSYAHALVSICASKDAMSVVHKYARARPALISELIDHIVEHLELDAKRIRKTLTVGLQHHCCSSDWDQRRRSIFSLHRDLSYMINKLTVIRASTKHRLLNAMLRTCGRSSMTPEEVLRQYEADEVILSYGLDDLLLVPLAKELTELEERRPSHISAHDQTCKRGCKCRPCAGCAVHGAKLRCARCDCSSYCCRECFRSHWHKHSLWCTPDNFDEEPGFRPRKYVLDGDRVVIVEERAALPVAEANAD